MEVVDPKTKTAKKIIPLDFPITIKTEGGSRVQVHQIEIGRLKAKHLKFLPDSFMETGKISPSGVVPLVAALAGISEESAGEIDIKDLNKVIDGVQSFLA